MQGGKDAVHRHVEGAGLLAVQFHFHLRGGRVEGGGQTSDFRALGGELLELRHILGEVIDTAAGAILKLHGETRDVAIAGQWWRAEGHGARTGDGMELPVPLRGDRLGVEAWVVAFLPWIETHEHERGIGHIEVVENVDAGQAHGRTHTLGVADDFLDLFEHLVAALQGCSLRQFDGHEKIALVLVRDEAAGHMLAETADADDHNDQQQHGKRGLAHESADDGAVALDHPVEALVEQAEERGDGTLAGFGFAQQQGGERGAQGQCVDDRENHRHGDRDGKLLIERAGHASHESHGHEHRAKHQADGHHWAGNFFHRLTRGFLGRFAVLDVMLHGLHHDDRIIHHDADGQHQAEHGEHVHAESEHRKHDEGAQQRNGDRAHRNERGTEALQENINHQQHQDHRLDQGVHDFLHRRLDRQRGVERDVIDHVGRELRLGLVEDLPDVFRSFQCVGSRCQVDGEGTCGRLVETRAQVVGLCAQFHTGNVLDLHLRTIRIGTDDDLLELLGILEQAQCADVVLRFLARWCGLCADAAGGRLRVLLLQCGFDVIGSDAQRGQFVRL